ncbi:MAG: SDR family NAD(P)-dependent oxidoreductase [Planctomycetota bacterium]
MPRRQLTGKRAIVTGASSGIGRCLALELAKAGVRVLACARREEKLVELQQAAAGVGASEIATLAGDVTDSDFRDQLLKHCVLEFGGLDILINNAGTTAMGQFKEAGEQRLRSIFEVNFFAIAELTRVAIPLLQNGDMPVVVNVSSVLGHRAVPYKSEYSASKFAVHGFSDALRAELKKDGIDVLLISPGTTDSDFFDSAIEDSVGRNWKKGGAMSPDVVARKTIIAIRKRKQEIILSAGGTFLVWLDRICPPLANLLVARYG